MKGYVFIGWNNGNDLAIAVKNKLDKEGYIGVVGGDYELNPDSMKNNHPTINETIRYQMDKTDKAIILFRQPQDTSLQRGNLLYELGYIMARYNTSETFSSSLIFKVNIPKENEINIFPSDLEGTWGINICGEDVDKLAEEVVNKFLIAQKTAVPVKKISLFNDYYKIEYEINHHLIRKMMSDYNLAVNILIYSQVSFVYHRVSEARKFLEKFYQDYYNSIHEDSIEIDCALEYASLAFDLFDASVPDINDGIVHLDRRPFRKMLNKFNDLLKKILRVDDDNLLLENYVYDSSGESFDMFTGMFISQLQQHATYLHLLYLDELDGEAKIERINVAINYALNSIKNLKNMIDNNGNDLMYYNLFLSYSYRDLRVFYKLLGNEDKVKEYDNLSLSTRAQLCELGKLNNINPTFKRYLELEHFLQVCDMFDSFTLDQKEDYLDDINDYIIKTKAENSLRTIMFDRLVEIYNSFIK